MRPGNAILISLVLQIIGEQMTMNRVLVLRKPPQYQHHQPTNVFTTHHYHSVLQKKENVEPVL
jgi:hypothetical protein